MINPDCPHVVPSLDHPAGEYCPKCNGGPCQRARKNPPEIVSDSHSNQGFEAFDRAIHAKHSDSHSDSLKRRGSSNFWQECGPYRSKGRTYYRYRWGKGRKIEGVKHIPGGAMTSDLVRNRAYRVYQAVEVEKKPHGEVLELIKSWGRNRRG